jgi:N-acetylmuramoyl-L-alanine amidase CwlA
MSKTKYNVPFVHAAGDGGKRTRTQMIVIHATDNTASAKDEASYASHRPDKISAHFYVDTKSVYQALLLDHVAWGCFPSGNSRSIQLELTGRSNAIPAATVTRAAKLVAQICKDWGIPAVHVGPAALRAGTKGICGHGDVTNAWHEGDHTDPGSKFPWASFIAQVKAELNRLNGVKPPAPKPVSTNYIVRTGDSLWSIAVKFKTTVAKLLGLNPKLKTHPDDINPGDSVKVK